jgi:ABC-type transport system involved in cytochrome c biogenesis permease subunit
MAPHRRAGDQAEYHPARQEGVLRPDGTLNLLLLLLYVAAGVAYAIHFAKRQPAVGRAATTLLLFAVLAHTFAIGMQTMEVRHVPYANPSRAISTFVWLLTLSYLYLELTTDERAMGVFILPIVIGLQTIPVFYPGMENMDPVLDSPWFWIHVSSLLFAYASFALAGMLGLTYMLQFKEIKKKHLGYFYTRLPALHVLDAMNSRAVAVGWLFLTIGVVVGVLWTAQARAIAPDNSNLQMMSLNDPKIFFAVLTWAVYSFAVFARRTLGWTGRRAAWLSALGFAIVLLNFLPVSYFVTTSHTFN